MRIYKYRIPIDQDTSYPLPEGAKILHVGLQDNFPHIWAAVDPDAKKEAVRFRWVATGEDFDGRGEYIGTIQPGPYVFHLFRL